MLLCNIERSEIEVNDHYKWRWEMKSNGFYNWKDVTFFVKLKKNCKKNWVTFTLACRHGGDADS